MRVVLCGRKMENILRMLPRRILSRSLFCFVSAGFDLTLISSSFGVFHTGAMTVVPIDATGDVGRLLLGAADGVLLLVREAKFEEE
jgi:hypothetical protein